MRWVRLSALVLMSLLLAACGRAPAAPGGAQGAAKEGPASPKEAPTAHAVGGRVVLTAEAMARAGITTETVRMAPFSATLSVPARLSPTPETPEEMEARLAYHAADARFTQTSAAAERLRRLAADNVVSSKSLQAAEADFAQARVDRMRAETALRNLGLDPSREGRFPRADLWALADIYDSQVPQVRPGARAWVRVESFPVEPFDAKVIALATSMRPQSRTLTVRIAVRDARHRLRPQEPATVDVEVASHPALSVPSQALLYQGEARVLFVRRTAGTFEMIHVRVGAEQAGRAEILGGVREAEEIRREGDAIRREGGVVLREGDEVVTRGAQVLLGEAFKSSIPSEEEAR